MSFVTNLCIAAALIVAWCPVHAADTGQWVTATNFADPEGLWVDPPSSADDSLASYASDISNRVGDGPFLECGFADVVHTDHLQVTADFGFGIVDSVEIDAQVGGAWTPLYMGAIANAEPTVLSFAAVDTQRIRFRFHYLQDGYYFWLYDLRVFAAPASVAPPSGTTLAASSVTGTTAVLHGRIDDDGGGLCQVRFEYGLDATYGSATDWSGSYATSQAASSVLLDVAGLLADSTYHCHMLVRNDSGVVADGGDVVFHTAAVREGDVEWLSPSGFDATDTAWIAKSAAIDDDPTTSARHYHTIGDDQWSPDLSYTLSPVRTEYLRFSAGRSQDVDAIHIDVHRDGEWVVAYEGDFADQSRQICGFAPGSVDAVRVRVHVSTTAVGMYLDLYDIAVRVRPVIAFAATSSRVAQGAGVVALPLVMRPASSVPVTVSWTLSGDAALGTDLDATPPATFAVGDTSAAIPVTVRSSGAAVDRTATFRLAGAVAATVVEPSSYALTIAASAAPNQPPVVSAGPDRTTAIDQPFTLHGTATDDGIPGPLTVTWTLASGPGQATFDAANALDTAVHFSAPGVYVVRLSATDTALTTSAVATITVTPANQAPTVSAGADQTVTLPAAADLHGVASDDGLPNGTLTTHWSMLSGPAAVTFADASAPATTASFSAPGTYVLRLSASDGALVATSDVTVTVLAGSSNLAPVVVVSGDQSVAFGSAAHLDGVVFDDGQPNGTLTQTWSTATGPASAVFLDPQAAITLATFPAAGVYDLRLTASDGALTSSADLIVTVVATSGGPTIATPASATPNPVTATTSALKVLGASPLGESKLTYRWSQVSGPGVVGFPLGANGANQSKSLVATFGAAGSYVLGCVVTDANGATTSSSVTVTVVAKPVSISIDPASATIAPLSTLAYRAMVRDQFGAAIDATLLPVQWSVDGLATIGSDGVLVAANAPGTTTVRAKAVATAATATASASLTISDPASRVASRSPLVEPKPFRAGDWTTDVAYASAYLATEDPARALVAAPQADGVPRLAATNGTYFRPDATGIVALRVRAVPGAPVSFLCLGKGVLSGAQEQKHVTVAADIDGLAVVSFKTGGTEPDAVVASSPSASGTVRFTIEP